MKIFTRLILTIKIIFIGMLVMTAHSSYANTPSTKEMQQNIYNKVNNIKSAAYQIRDNTNSIRANTAQIKHNTNSSRSTLNNIQNNSLTNIQSYLEKILKALQDHDDGPAYGGFSPQSILYMQYTPILQRSLKYKYDLLEKIHVKLYGPSYTPKGAFPFSSFGGPSIPVIKTTSFFDVNNASKTEDTQYTFSNSIQAEGAKKLIYDLLGLTSYSTGPFFKNMEPKKSDRLVFETISKKKGSKPPQEIIDYLNYKDSMTAIQMITANNLLSSYTERLPFSSKGSEDPNKAYGTGVSLRDVIAGMNTNTASNSEYWGKDGDAHKSLFVRLQEAITQSFKLGYTLFDIGRQLEGIRLQLGAASAQTTILIQKQYGEQLYQAASKKYSELKQDEAKKEAKESSGET